MAPMPCQVWLRETDLWITQGMKYPLDEGSGENRRLLYRDAYATLINRNNKIGLLRADVSKSLWRDVHLFMEMRQIDRSGESAAPRNLISHADSLQKTGVTLWAGELIKAKDAKVVDIVESTFTIPPAMFGEDGRGFYQAGVEFAESQSYRLKLAVTEYGKAMKSESAPEAKAQNRYWHTLDRESSLLLALVGKPLSIAYSEKGNPWGDLVREAAREAYEATCPRQTPRQIQAFAEGLKKLSVPKPKPQST
jgi:hypothetical protein